MTYRNRWTATALLCCSSILAGSGLHAETLATHSKSPASPSLADSVNRVVQAMHHIDTRLLSDEHIERVEASGNYEAIAILHRSLNDRELVEEQINQGRFDEAYIAMRAIEERITVSIRRSWAHERQRRARAGQAAALTRAPAPQPAARSEG